MRDDVVRLLRKSETRRFNRRRLLQALGLSATSVALGSVWPREAWAQGAQPPANPRTFAVTTMNHISYQCTSDYSKVRDWYMDLFGGDVVFDDGEQSEVSFGDRQNPNGMYVRPASGRPYRSGVPGIAHLSFGLPNIMQDMAALKAELERWKVGPVTPNGAIGWNVNDPAGIHIEVVTLKHLGLFPGSGARCQVVDSKECNDLRETGLRNLDKKPKPSGRGFKAVYFTNIVLDVPSDKVAIERNFYRDLLGMRVMHETPRRVILRFGGNTMVVAGTLKPGEAARGSRFGFEIENYDSAKVEAELKRRGLNPKPNMKLAWTVQDPDGQIVDVAGAGFAEELART